MEGNWLVSVGQCRGLNRLIVFVQEQRYMNVGGSDSTRPRNEQLDQWRSGIMRRPHINIYSLNERPQEDMTSGRTASDEIQCHWGNFQRRMVLLWFGHSFGPYFLVSCVVLFHGNCKLCIKWFVTISCRASVVYCFVWILSDFNKLCVCVCLSIWMIRGESGGVIGRLFV